jgi:hypothetical protein
MCVLAGRPQPVECGVEGDSVPGHQNAHRSADAACGVQRYFQVGDLQLGGSELSSQLPVVLAQLIVVPAQFFDLGDERVALPPRGSGARRASGLDSDDLRGALVVVRDWKRFGVHRDELRWFGADPAKAADGTFRQLAEAVISTRQR